MRSFIVVVATPGFDLLPCVLDRHEPVLIQAFCTQPTIEGFVQAIIRGLSAAADFSVWRCVHHVSNGSTVLSYESPQDEIEARYLARWVRQRWALEPWSFATSATVSA
jgi:hypothetical protein